MTEPQHHQQMDVVKVNDDNGGASGLQALIEKVVNDEIKKLAHETIDTSEAITMSSDVISSTQLDDATADGSTTESLNPDSETLSPTTTTIVEVAKETPQPDLPVKVFEDVSTATSGAATDEETVADDSISDSLLNAVGDLLSSILGLDASGGAVKTVDGDIVVRVDDGAISQEKIASTSATDTETTTLVFESTEAAESEQSSDKVEDVTSEVSDDSPTTVQIGNLLRDKEMSEIDLKIENLANFGTEQVTADMLETLPVMTDGDKPVSFEDSINQVMSVVKGSEGRLPVESVVDSILIDKHMKENVNDLDDIVYGTLMEIESNLGLSGGVNVPFEPTERYDYNKDFESEISKTLITQNAFDHGSFIPNSAKAALFYKQEDDANFPTS